VQGVKNILIETSPEIVALAKELGISLNPERVRNIVLLGMESLNQEAELELGLKKLEEEKRCLSSNFQKKSPQKSARTKSGQNASLLGVVKRRGKHDRKMLCEHERSRHFASLACPADAKDFLRQVLEIIRNIRLVKTACVQGARAGDSTR